jgi:hypothetical protein
MLATAKNKIYETKLQRCNQKKHYGLCCCGSAHLMDNGCCTNVKLCSLTITGINAASLALAVLDLRCSILGLAELGKGHDLLPLSHNVYQENTQQLESFYKNIVISIKHISAYNYCTDIC